ncbi:MAG: hypothetical protein NDI91_19430 [Sulfuritalea sp.]|nr:hypothetical protein [Sulfuritalea sp.]
MAFVNEKMSDEDKSRISSTITYEKISAQAQWIPNFSEPSRWAVDRERGTYLIFLTGGGREQLPYYVLGVDGQTVVFNVYRNGEGSDTAGSKEHWEVHDLRIPPALESRREEVKQLIREGLEEYAYFRPLADGGTFENPNTVARGNIISFSVEFK